MVKEIIINFPTNLGDTILTLPAFDLVRASYPEAKITAIVSPKTKDFLSHHTYIDEFVVYDKLWKKKEKLRFVLSLNKNKYDLMVDFKNSFLPFLLKVEQRTSFIRRYPASMHTKDRYLKLVEKIVKIRKADKGKFVLKEEEERWAKYNIEKSIFIATASHSSLKVYPYRNLKPIVESLSRKYRVVLLGDAQAKDYYKDIGNISGVLDLAGKTSFLDVYYLLKNFSLLCVAVDSSILHLASYLNLGVVALFGPTDISRYGPWSENSRVLFREDLPCRPCRQAVCKANYQCMDIEEERVIEEINYLLNSGKRNFK